MRKLAVLLLLILSACGPSQEEIDDTATPGYCRGSDDSVADCRLDGLFDPWIAGGGVQHLSIDDYKVEVFPLLLPSRSDAEKVRFGYLQFTSREPKRNPETQDVFRAWWSAEPAGEPLEGSGCEWWEQRARGSMYWTQDSDIAEPNVCNLGTTERIIFLNFETRCLPGRYRGAGVCDADNPQKRADGYRFEVTRSLKGY
jgi:hypothetical protein